MKKYLFAVLINMVPFFLCCLLYAGGLGTIMLFPFFQFFINWLNCKWTDKIIPYISLNVIMLFSSVISNRVTTYLYYYNISSDTETLAVGNFSEIVAFVIISLLTVVSLICKAVINHWLKEEEKGSDKNVSKKA